MLTHTLTCMISPLTKCSITVDITSTTSKLRSLARETDALDSKKSPPRIASLFPKTWLTDGTPLRVDA